MRKKLLSITAILIFILFSCTAAKINAQITYGWASNLPIIDKDVKDGDIISTNSRGFALAKIAYDPAMIGVVNNDPAVVITLSGGSNTHPVVSSGEVYVNVSLINGPIKKGDFVTSSPILGVGMRATKSGNVLGTAMEDFSSKDPKEIKKMKVAMNIHGVSLNTSVWANVANVLSLSALASYEQPLLVFRYFTAAAVVIISFIIGFFTFGRVAAFGIEALGRNPLASRMIQLGIFINAIITIGIALVGLGVAFFIISF